MVHICGARLLVTVLLWGFFINWAIFPGRKLSSSAGWGGNQDEAFLSVIYIHVAIKFVENYYFKFKYW